MNLIPRFDGGSIHSKTLREIQATFHNVHIGKFTYGEATYPGVFTSGTVVGNYCSFAPGLMVYRRDHPINALSQHPFFYNSKMGFLQADSIISDKDNPLKIGHDVWIGARVTILSGCRTIGNGAIVSAGAVLTKDVPPYAIVGGVPGKIIRYRFKESTIAMLEESEWWDLELHELLEQHDMLSLSISEREKDD